MSSRDRKRALAEATTGSSSHERGAGEAKGRQGREGRQNFPSGVRVLGRREVLPVDGGADARVATIAGLQRGRVSRSQLIQVGISRHVISSMLDSGRLIRQYRGVYAVGHSAEVRLGREAAALLACGGGAALSHRTAASIWALGGPLGTDHPVEVTIAGRETSRTRTGIIVHRSSLIRPIDIVIRDGLPVTSPAWALLDLAAHTSTREAERSLDEALAQRLVSLTKLRELLTRVQGRHGGQRVLSHLLGGRSGPSTVTRSEAEEQMLALIRAAQLPAPQLNVRVCGYEVDFHWPEHQLVLEVDGYAWHSGRSAFERDRRKGIALARAGIELLRVSWRQIQEESLPLVAGLAARLAARSSGAWRVRSAGGD